MHRTGTMETPHPQAGLCSSWLTALLTFLTIGIFLLQARCPSAGNRAEAQSRPQFIGHCLLGKPIKRRQKVGVVPELEGKKKEHEGESSRRGYRLVPICFILSCLQRCDKRGLELTDASEGWLLSQWWQRIGLVWSKAVLRGEAQISPGKQECLHVGN